MSASRFKPAVLVVGLIVAALIPATAAASAPLVAVSPALTPSIFSVSVPNYTVTCATGSVSVTTNVARGSIVTVDGRRAATGRVETTSVPLTPGQRFVIVTGAGRSAASHSVRCIPSDFPVLAPHGTLPASSSFMGISSAVLVGTVFPYAIITDAHGVSVWWKQVETGWNAMDVKALSGGRIGFWQGILTSDEAEGPFSIYSLDGTKLGDVMTPIGGGDPHETQPLSDGTFYRASYVRRDHVDLTSVGGPADGSVTDAVIQQIDPAGNLVWSWNSKDHLSPAESSRWFPIVSALTAAGGSIDMVHLNSVSDDGRGGLVVSFRHLDGIFRIRKSDGAIDWKLGGTPTSRSLAVIGDDAHAGVNLAGQHDARVLADGTVTTFDNGSGYANRPPRATRWRINTTKRTATLIESLSDPSFTDASVGGGSARRLSDGSWLIDWCHYPNVRAYTPAHKLRFDLTFITGGRTYRANPIPASLVSGAALAAGMDSMYPR